MQSWEQIEELYFHALDLDENERNTFLSQISEKDAGLATRIEKMIGVAFQTNQFLESLQGALWEGLESMNLKPLAPGTQVGKYTIDQLLGKGGMGQVYAAHRSDGEFEQKVAIKILGKYSNKSLEEQRILGKLQHPHIARIFDAGKFEEEASYIVMELVDGLPIDIYVQQNQLDLQSRLRLFLDVCQAIHFSHQNLILHQDIKPANILVDYNGEVKVLDFGIGKLLLSVENTNAVAATPYYASPEQLRREATGISSDIYQLGIVLYKLICDALPFESKYEEEGITRIIVPDDKQAIQAYKSHPRLYGELESIVKHCLELSPADRYASVSVLQKDIEDFLQGKAISVHSEAWTYRAFKYLKRNNVAVSAAAIVLLSLFAALIVSIHQGNIARKERDKAQVTNDFLIELFASANPMDNYDKDFKEYKYLDFIRERKDLVIQDKALSKEQKWEVLALLQKLFYNLTQWEESRQTAEAMLELAKESKKTAWIAESYFQLASVYNQEFEFDQAEKYFDSLAILLPKISNIEAEKMVMYTKELGLFFHLSGDYATAEEHYKNALEIAGKSKLSKNDEIIRTTSNYSQLLRSTGRFDSALLLSNWTIAAKLEKLNGDSLNVNMSNSYADRALIYMEDADYELAEKDFALSVSILESKWDSLNQNYEFIMGNYVILKCFKKEYEAGVALARKLKSHVLSVYGAESVSAAYAHLHLGESLTGLGELAEGREELEKGKALVQQFMGENHVLSGIFSQHLSRNAILSGDFPQAEKHALASLEIFAKSLPPDHYRQFLSKMRHTFAAWKVGSKDIATTQVKESIEELKVQGKRVFPYLDEAESYLGLL